MKESSDFESNEGDVLILTNVGFEPCGQACDLEDCAQIIEDDHAVQDEYYICMESLGILGILKLDACVHVFHHECLCQLMSGVSVFSNKCSECTQRTFRSINKTPIPKEHTREMVLLCGSKISKLRHSMPCIKMPEVAYVYRYLLVSAWVCTPECDISIAYFAGKPIQR